MTQSNEQTIYELVGGETTFQQLAEAFYSRVEQDEVLRSLFPQDLEPGKRWQYLFLSQFFGGPQEYGLERGHPRLRMRHAPFAIDQEMRDRWLHHMIAAVDDVAIQEPMRSVMVEYFVRASTHMINRGEINP